MGSTNLRDYTFNAGPLRHKKVRDITDDKLNWAIRYNREYIETYENPQAMCRFQGRRITVAMLPPGVAQRRAELARTALEACLHEKQFRGWELEADDADNLAQPAATTAELAPGDPLTWAREILQQRAMQQTPDMIEKAQIMTVTLRHVVEVTRRELLQFQQRVEEAEAVIREMESLIARLRGEALSNGSSEAAQ